MAKMTKLEALAVESLLNKFFSGYFLDICVFHNIKEILGHNGVSKRDYEALSGLHCHHWNAMRPELKEEIHRIVWGTFRAALDEAIGHPTIGPKEKDITPMRNPRVIEMAPAKPKPEPATATQDAEEARPPRPTFRHRWNSAKRSWGF